MHGFNPLKGLAIMLAVFLGMDFILLGGRFGREIMNGISNLF